MILAQVREDERGEADAIEAAELRAVRRCLHRAAAVTGVEHLPESPLDVNRLRRGPSGRPAFASDPALDRPDQPRSCPRSGEDRVEQKRGGRLAVRAGHAGDLELLARVPEELVRGDRHRAAGIRDDKLGDAEVEWAFDDEGWFHTGDVGRWTDDGFLQIVDRKKDILVTAGGKNVPPANIEVRFKDDPFIAHLVVYGDAKRYLVAGVWLNEPAVKAHLSHQLSRPRD